MAQTCGIYKDGVELGTGSITTTSVASYSGIDPFDGRNIQVLITEGTNIGESYSTRVMSGSGTATLTLKDADPFA